MSSIKQAEPRTAEKIEPAAGGTPVIQTLILHPHDKLIVSTPCPLPREKRQRLMRDLSLWAGTDVKVLVVDEQSLKLTIIRRS